MAREAYVSGAELADELKAGNTGFTRDDDLIEALVLAASHAVDSWCFRAFDPPADTPSTRLLRGAPCGTHVYPLPDIANSTSLALETLSGASTWTAVAADAWWAEMAQEGDGRVEAPGMVVGLNGTFPAGLGGRPGVRVTANWGWPSVPEPVKRATLLLARRYYVRKDSPAGTLGFGDMGAVRLSRHDPDVIVLLGPYRRKGLLLG